MYKITLGKTFVFASPCEFEKSHLKKYTVLQSQCNFKILCNMTTNPIEERGEILLPSIDGRMGETDKENLRFPISLTPVRGRA